jgi:hypothetical protein
MLSASGAAALNAYNQAATMRSVIMSNVAYGSGSPQWDLPHAGIPTSVLLNFSGNLTVKNGTTVGTVTASPLWPFNILGLSSLLDYQGNTRIFADGWDLFKRDMVLGQGVNPKDPYQQTNAIATLYTATIPTGKASATVTSPVNFSVTLPISLSEGSAYGSYLATVPQGNAQILGTENTLTGKYINSPLTTSTSTVTVGLTGTWTPVYYYLDAPSSVGVPVAALSEIHEFYHQNSPTDQLIPGGNPQQVLLTGRDYYRVFCDIYASNKLVMSQTSPQINQISFLVDSSTPTVQNTFASYLAKINRKFHSMFPFILYDFMSAPWSPNNYGSLTSQQTLTNNFTSGAYKNYVTTRETMYSPSGNLIAVGG